MVRAKALFGQAEVHFNVGEFKKALDLYSKAYKTKQLAAFLFNIAQCHRYLKDHDRAIFFYNRFLSQKPDTPHRAMVEGFIEQCRKAKEEAERQPQPASQPASQPVEPTRPPTISFDEAVREAPEPADKPSSILLWTGIGVSSALLVGGTVTAVIANNKNEEYRDPSTPVDRRLELRDSGRPLGVAAVVMLGLGGAAAIGTGVYYFIYYRAAGTESSEGTPPTVSIAPLPEGGGAVVLGGRF